MATLIFQVVFKLLILQTIQKNLGTSIKICFQRLTHLGAVHMSRASPANRADLSHENLYFSTT